MCEGETSVLLRVWTKIVGKFGVIAGGRCELHLEGNVQGHVVQGALHVVAGSFLGAGA